MKCRCAKSGKFMSKEEILKCEIMMAIKQQSVLFGCLLAVTATAIAIYI